MSERLFTLWHKQCPGCVAKAFQRCFGGYDENGDYVESLRQTCESRRLPYRCWKAGGHDYVEDPSDIPFRACYTATCSRCGKVQQRGLGTIPIGIDLVRITPEDSAVFSPAIERFRKAANSIKWLMPEDN